MLAERIVENTIRTNALIHDAQGMQTGELVCHGNGTAEEAEERRTVVGSLVHAETSGQQGSPRELLAYRWRTHQLRQGAATSVS